MLCRDIVGLALNSGGVAEARAPQLGWEERRPLQQRGQLFDLLPLGGDATPAVHEGKLAREHDLVSRPIEALRHDEAQAAQQLGSGRVTAAETLWPERSIVSEAVRCARDRLGVVQAAVMPDEVVQRRAEAVLLQERIPPDPVELGERSQHVRTGYVGHGHESTLRSAKTAGVVVPRLGIMTDALVDDSWFPQDRRVLAVIVKGLDADRHTRIIGPAQIEQQAGLTADEVEDSLFRLSSEPAYIGGPKLGNGNFQYLNAVSAEARRRVGQWPTPETLADQIVAALKGAADDEPDEIKRGKLRDAAQRLTESVVSGVLTSWASGALG